jgi:hypothetical protein
VAAVVVEVVEVAVEGVAVVAEEDQLALLPPQLGLQARLRY